MGQPPIKQSTSSQEDHAEYTSVRDAYGRGLTEPSMGRRNSAASDLVRDIVPLSSQRNGSNNESINSDMMNSRKADPMEDIGMDGFYESTGTQNGSRFFRKRNRSRPKKKRSMNSLFEIERVPDSFEFSNPSRNFRSTSAGNSTKRMTEKVSKQESIHSEPKPKPPMKPSQTSISKVRDVERSVGSASPGKITRSLKASTKLTITEESCEDDDIRRSRFSLYGANDREEIEVERKVKQRPKLRLPPPRMTVDELSKAAPRPEDY